MERSGTTGASPTQDVNPTGQQAPADQAQPAAQPDKQSGGSPDSQPGGGRWRRRGDQAESTPPWRVEGMPDKKQDQAGGRPNWRRFWLILLALLLLNWILAGLLTGAAARTTCS